MKSLRSRSASRRVAMTLCPIAVVAGCEKCPAFKICPLKGVIGSPPKAAEPHKRASAKKSAGSK